MMDQLSLEAALQARNDAMASVADHAGDAFRAQAEAFMVTYLTQHGATAGEVLTEACKAAGIIPHDDRAFGPVYMRLSRRGTIEKCGLVQRKRGHMTSGGNVWRLTEGGAA